MKNNSCRNLWLGKYAFIGIGFQERSDAFDFSVSIQDHQKRIERLEKKIDLSQYPTKDYSMKEGETIKVNLVWFCIFALVD